MTSPPNIATQNKKSRNTAFLLLTVLILAAYSPAIFNDFVDWDDLTLIVQNPRFNHPTWATVTFYFTHPFQNLYMPLTCALWAALAKVGEINNSDALGARINPYVFHLAGVLLHLIAACAVLGILHRTTRMIWPALAGALLFALHPLQVESVAFVGAMNTVLAGALTLSAIWFYLKSADELQTPALRPALSLSNGYSEEPDSQTRRTFLTPTYILATLLFILAMLSKPTAIVAPAIAFLLDRLTTRRTLRASILSVLPWILLAIPCLIWTSHLQPGAKIATAQPLWTRPVIAADSTVFYLGKLICPTSLGIDYGQTPAIQLQHSRCWIILPIALLLLIAFSRRRYPLIAIGIATFLLALLPNSGLIPFDYQQFSTTADRYIYLSMLGVAIIFAACVALVNQRAIFAIIIATTTTCAILTESQIRTWHNGESLFRHAIEVNPNSWMSRSNLANIIMDHSPGDAITQCQIAIQSQPNFTPAWGNLGSALEIKGDRTAALHAFARAYQLEPNTPPFAANYARALADTGHLQESAEIYHQIQNRDPTTAQPALDHLSSKH